MIDYNKTYMLTKNFTILYVEDDKSFLRETSEVFSDFFFRVDTATNGAEALEKYKDYFTQEKKHYDIVITDINMPVMNGIELTKEIYKIEETQPIIVISAHNDAPYLLELVNLGIEQFLLKPIDFDTLLGILHNTTCKLFANNPCNKNTKIISLKDDISWDKELSLLYNGENIIKLSKNETLLMEIFIKNECKISTLQEITSTLYDEHKENPSDILKPLVSRLRKKMIPQPIESVYSLGYRLVF